MKTKTTMLSAKRVIVESTLTFDHVLENLYGQLGRRSVDLKAISAATTTWEAYEDAVSAHAGPTGFMLFTVLDYGAWIRKAGLERRELRLIFGNPLIAFTMISQDLSAALFVPVELLLTERADGKACKLEYIVPSSLMLTDVSPRELGMAARSLDHKMAELVSVVSG